MADSESHSENDSNHHEPRPEPTKGYRELPVYEYRSKREEEIDLIELIQFVWNRRLSIIKITAVFILLGLFIAIFSPVEYRSEATLIPEIESTQGRASNLLQQYGGILGISGGGALGQESAVPPQLYPNMVQSLPYQIELMRKPIYFSRYDTTVTIQEFFEKVYTRSVLSYFKEYTIGLPGTIIGLFSSSDSETIKSLRPAIDRDSVITLSPEQKDIILKIRDRLSANMDEESGILKFSAEFPDPQASARIAEAGISLLKEHVKEFRTQKARRNVVFIEEQVERARKRFEKAQQKYAEFQDSNIGQLTAKAQTREQELQSQYDLTFNLYNSLSQQLEQARLELQEETPVFKVLEPVSVPLDKSSPKRLLILIVSGVVGGAVSITWIFFKNWFETRGKSIFIAE